MRDSFYRFSFLFYSTTRKKGVTFSTYSTWSSVKEFKYYYSHSTYEQYSSHPLQMALRNMTETSHWLQRTHRTVRIVSRNGHVFNGKGKETDRETETEKGPTLFYTAWVRAIGIPANFWVFCSLPKVKLSRKSIHVTHFALSSPIGQLEAASASYALQQSRVVACMGFDSHGARCPSMLRPICRSVITTDAVMTVIRIWNHSQYWTEIGDWNIGAQQI